MSMTTDVAAFMRAVGQEAPAVPQIPGIAVMDLRRRLVTEEYQELMDAMDAQDLEAIADACVDLVYVVIGCALAHGLPVDALWTAVHHANMAKTKGPKRPDGKQLKPPGWQPPNVAAILKLYAEGQARRA